MPFLAILKSPDAVFYEFKCKFITDFQHFLHSFIIILHFKPQRQIKSFEQVFILNNLKRKKHCSAKFLLPFSSVLCGRDRSRCGVSPKTLSSVKNRKFLQLRSNPGNAHRTGRKSYLHHHVEPESHSAAPWTHKTGLTWPRAIICLANQMRFREKKKKKR